MRNFFASYSALSLLILVFCEGTALYGDDMSGISQPSEPATSVEPTRHLWDSATMESDGSEMSRARMWSAGADFVFVRPHFDRNVAFTRTESDGVAVANVTDVEFDYDYRLAERIWAGYETVDGVGLRATYFTMGDSTPTLTASPPGNGFGGVSQPFIGSTSNPTDTFSARSGLDLYSVDIDVTKRADFATWTLVASAGVGYASIQQHYFLEVRNGAGALTAQADFRHDLNGFGPTIGLQTRRPLTDTLSVFGRARGSVLFGEGESLLGVGQRLAAVNPAFTSQTARREDVLPIGELHVGFDYLSRVTVFGQFAACVALEGQIWSGVGNSTSEDGSLGLLGLTTGVGLFR